MSDTQVDALRLLVDAAREQARLAQVQAVRARSILALTEAMHALACERQLKVVG